MSQPNERKTIFDLKEIITRCFEESKKMGYIKDNTFVANTIVNQNDLVQHIAMTVIGELYEFEIIRRIAPIFRENRALSTDFQMYGEAFQYFYDKHVQDLQLHSLRINNEGGD